MENFFWQTDYFITFIETGPLSCIDNYVDLHQPLICVDYDTNPCVLPASIMRCLFTYVGLLYSPSVAVNDSAAGIWLITPELILTEEPTLAYHALRPRLTVDKISL